MHRLFPFCLQAKDSFHGVDVLFFKATKKKQECKRVSRGILRTLQFRKEYLRKRKILHIFAIYFWGSMLISNKLILDDFVQRHSRAVRPINKWIEVVAQAVWRNHQDLKKCFPSADYVGNGRYVFNISGNNYRIIAVVLFVGGVMELRFVGTHAEYDKIKDCSVI